jgi:hypothetical protein
LIVKLNKRLSKAKTDKQKQKIVKSILVGSHGLYKTWPREVWTCRLDRKLFEIRIGKLLKRHIKTKLSAKELLLSARNEQFYAVKIPLLRAALNEKRTPIPRGSLLLPLI